MRFPLKNLVFTYWRYVLGVLIVLLVGGYLFLGRGSNLGATLTILTRDFKEQVSVSGTVTATKNVELGFATNGRIAGTYADVGQYVDTGTILAETENGDLTAAVVQKKAALLQAQANLASLQAGTRPEEIAIASVAVTSAESALVNAIQSAFTTSEDSVRNKTDSFFTNPRTSPKLSITVTSATLQNLVENDRLTTESALANWSTLLGKLSNGNAITSAKQVQLYVGQVITLLADANAALNQAVPDQANTTATLSSYATTLATARANVNTAAATLTSNITALQAAQSTLVLKQAGPTSETIAAQIAAVAVAAADVRSAEAKLAATRVIAPFPGIVTRMDAKVGEIVSPNTSEISMQSNGIFEIETFIPEVTIARVAAGNTATTTLDAYGSSIGFPAKVIAVDPAETIKDGVPTYKTTLAFLQADPRIRSGMTANIIIETGMLHDAIVIPSGAIGIKNGLPYVSVVDYKQAILRTIVTGSSPALGQSQVLSGLSSGEVILLTPAP